MYLTFLLKSQTELRILNLLTEVLITLHISNFDYEMRNTGKSSYFTVNCSSMVHTKLLIIGLFYIIFKQNVSKGEYE